MALLYIWGQPGAGKSALVKALVEGDPSYEYKWGDLYITEYLGANVTELGRERPDFRGTDALGMTAIVSAERFMKERVAQSVMAEGDRLAVDRFFQAAEAGGYALEPVFLDTPDKIAAERRAARGSAQNETWVKGRISKARAFADRWEPFVLDGSKSIPELVQDLMAVSTVAAQFQPAVLA